MHKVLMDLRSDVDGRRYVQAQRSAEVSGEVVAADEICAPSAAARGNVETSALGSDSAHEGKAHTRNLARVNRVEIVEDRAVVDDVLVIALRCSPGDFAVQSEVVQENRVHGKDGIYASS